MAWWVIVLVVVAQRRYVVWRHNVVKIYWRILVVRGGVRRIYHDTPFGLDSVRTKYISAISWTYWCESDRAIEKVFVLLTVGRVIVL